MGREAAEGRARSAGGRATGAEAATERAEDAAESTGGNSAESTGGNSGENSAAESAEESAEDSVDRHIARWTGKVPFDVPTEAVITRIQLLAKHVSHGKERALAETGLQAFEFETMHRLASRGAPWRAPSAELAAELLLSPAGMTGRLDTLEKSGLVRRLRAAADRRRVDVELTEEGHRRWLDAMRWRGVAEHEMIEPLDDGERAALAALLKRMLLAVETR
ncbi:MULTISPECIES: MarR family winged helix-turn-helix transcriptional regulator [Streptomyces]|uniref:MarR family winged helix-turn-helix transcriptional regulator n=1 Tax=Streptomyces TaxID=1883 RepID=UPI00099B7F80|nr:MULTISPECIES: MarR family winged helix-turn-helix transcriptional regulator [Streptomyces]